MTLLIMVGSCYTAVRWNTLMAWDIWNHHTSASWSGWTWGNNSSICAKSVKTWKVDLYRIQNYNSTPSTLTLPPSSFISALFLTWRQNYSYRKLSFTFTEKCLFTVPKKVDVISQIYWVPDWALWLLLLLNLDTVDLMSDWNGCICLYFSFVCGQKLEGRGFKKSWEIAGQSYN